jgi:preprotein translocase subunit SecA
VLGGNIEPDIKLIEADESLDHAAKEAKITALKADQAALNAKVKELGGLRIIATERHESRRIDNQLRGRAGRQGDPGSSRFYLSLDDPLMRIFAGDRVRAIMDRLKMPEGEAIEAGIVSRSIESAQRKVEGHNFDMRKQLLEYDDVSNDQRKVIYQQRNEILETQNVAESIANLRGGAMSDVVRTYVPASSMEEQWDLAGLSKVLRDEWHVEVDLPQWVAAASEADDEAVLDEVRRVADEAYQAKVASVGGEQFASFERMVLLQNMDSNWREHLASLDYLRQGIHLRGYAQKNPKQEYKREAFELFGQLLDTVKLEVTRMLMTVKIQSREEAQAAAQAIEHQGESISNVTYTHPDEDGSVVSETDPSTLAQEVPRVGRNDPCPCGSGQKYKNCHGKLA